MIKKILIGLGIVIVTAGIAYGVLYFIRSTQSSPKNNTSTATVLDHSKDYGACSILDSLSIKKALGDSATNLQKAEDMGIVLNKAVGVGVKDLTSDSQICVYAFGPGGTLANGFNSGDAFMIERIVYSNESGPKSLIQQIKSDSLATAVDGLGDAAFYNANTASTGPGAIYSFELEVFIAKTSVKYSIHQPAKSSSFTEASAKAGLIQLAQLAQPALLKLAK